MDYNEQALDYHRAGRPGKISVTPTKPCATQRDLSLAYTPGVAEPCRRIQADPAAAFDYTARGNLVAVVSNGSAVLGLGNIGALAGKPVMEGKGVLFKRFADIDVYDLELDTGDVEAFIQCVKLLEPTFGGINLEDIKAPECFMIEDRLKCEMDIPVFHDDQHGTAIISGAGLLNAAELAEKDLADLRIVINGAGAAGIACAKFYESLGAKRDNLVLCDSKGVIYRGREQNMNAYKEDFAADTPARTLAEALEGADVFSGLSVGGVVSQEMVKTMADRPIIFAMANPDPEIRPEEARAARPDAIIATGRSDYPNQINNVLGFPFIFRGALDVRAQSINNEMKIAAARALAGLTKEPVPYQVMQAYRLDDCRFGPDYIIPKPFDPRVLIWEAAAVAQAAVETGVARLAVDIEEYRERLEARLGLSRKMMRVMINKARKERTRVVFPEGDHPPVLKACETILEEGIAQPVLLGARERVEAAAESLGLKLGGGIEVIDPRQTERHDHYEHALYEMRRRKGVTLKLAHELMILRNYFGAMMVHLGDAGAMVTGLTSNYPDAIRPALQVIGAREDVKKAAATQMLLSGGQAYFIADVAMNVTPSAVELADIALMCADQARRFDIEPRVAMVSFSNFGGTRTEESVKMREAMERVREREPHLVIDGEIQADVAISPETQQESFPFSRLAETGANVLVFPCLSSSNAAFKLAQRLAGAESIGPILLGMKKPVHVLQFGTSNETDIVNMTAIAAVEAQEQSRTFAG